MTNLPQNLYIVYYDKYRNNLHGDTFYNEDEHRYCNGHCINKEDVIFKTENIKLGIRILRMLLDKQLTDNSTGYYNRKQKELIKWEQDLKYLKNLYAEYFI